MVLSLFTDHNFTLVCDLKLKDVHSCLDLGNINLAKRIKGYNMMFYNVFKKLIDLVLPKIINRNLQVKFCVLISISFNM